jgi:hypothetical protein
MSRRFVSKQGTLLLNNVEIQHSNHGIDIWNGNAAILVTTTGRKTVPHFDAARDLMQYQGVKVTSAIRAWIVNIDGEAGCASWLRLCGAPPRDSMLVGKGVRRKSKYTRLIHQRVGCLASSWYCSQPSGIYLEQGLYQHSAIWHFASTTLAGNLQRAGR